MSVLEAWSYRSPVLMSAACNLPEGFASGAAMELPLESQAMQGRLTEFLALSDATRTEMGLAGRHLVERRFTWNGVAREMASVYEWLLGDEVPPDVVEM